MQEDEQNQVLSYLAEAALRVRIAPCVFLADAPGRRQWSSLRNPRAEALRQLRESRPALGLHGGMVTR
jgi:hypothetical protein